jgi:hypothetical protein
MIRIERPEGPSPEELFRELHRNNAHILDRMKDHFRHEDTALQDLLFDIQRLQTAFEQTYSADKGVFEGEFNMEIPGKGILHVKFYNEGYMELSLE